MITNSFTIINIHYTYYIGHNIAIQYTGDTEKLERMILIQKCNEKMNINIIF